MLCLLAILLAVGGARGRQLTGVHAEFGGQQRSGDMASSKFSEYRNIAGGSVIDTLRLGFADPGFTTGIVFWGYNLARPDQEANAALASAAWIFQGQWNQIPHDLTNTARPVFAGSGGSMLTIPREVRSRLVSLVGTDKNPSSPGVQYDTLGVTNLLRGISRPADLSTPRDRWKGSARYLPSAEMEIRVDAGGELRDGAMPLGAGFFYHTPVEIVQPVHYRSTDAAVSAGYANRMWDARAAYAYARFHNDDDVLIWDNPFRDVDFIGAASRARMDLFPDNSAHTFSGEGGLNLPFRTRLTASVIHSIRLQNDPFTPLTINPAIETLRVTPALPAASLNGRVRTTSFNATAVNRLWSLAGLKVRYRVFVYSNVTLPLKFGGFVDEDNLLTLVRLQNPIVDFRTENTVVELSSRPLRSLSVTAGYERTNRHRNYGELETSQEDVLSARLTCTPAPAFRAWGSWSFGKRTAPGYDWTSADRELYPAGRPLGSIGEPPQFRHFDLAPRKRIRGSATAQWSISESWAFTGSLGILKDRYEESPYGLQWSREGDFTVDVSFIAGEEGPRIGARYTREDVHSFLRSRQRAFRNDTTVNDWISDIADGVNTVGLSCSWMLIPELLDCSLDFSLSDAGGDVSAAALGDVLSRLFVAGTAEDYPATREITRRLCAVLRYRLSDRLTPKLEYRYEGFTESLFRYDDIEPYMATVDPAASRAVFLGARQPGYSAHIIAFGLSYDL